MIKRLKEFIDNQRITIFALEQKIGCSEGTLRRAIKNNTDIQSKWISNICDNYPNLSIEWLLTGKGVMLKENNSETNSILPDNEICIGNKELYELLISQNEILKTQQETILLQQRSLLLTQETLKRSQEQLAEQQRVMIKYLPES